MKLRFLLLSLFFAATMFAQNGTVTGTILDKEFNNEPLPFANIVIKGTKQGASTDENGKYSISLKPGNYTLVIGYLGYETKEIPFTIEANEKKVINHTLEASGVQLQDIQIVQTVSKEKESALLQEQQKAVEIKQSIGAQEMSRKGISNVEQGVAKISGISKVADRGIFIRGLDDRYNYLQVNGLNLVPSDPNLKTIPLNYIPTDIVRNIDVFKTFNTDLFQDFAGASINVITKDISSKPVTKISLSSGFNTNTTLKKFKTANDGNLNFIGFDNGGRNLPSNFSYSNPSQYQATPSESANMFDASWNTGQDKAPLSIGTNVFHSNSHELDNDRKWGYNINANFSNNYLSQQGVRRNMNSSGFATKDFERNVHNYSTQSSFFGGFNYKKISKYNFSLNLIYLHNSESVVDEVRGDNIDFITTDRPFFLRDTKFVENATYSLQHLGTLYFKEKKNVLDYGIAASIGKNNMPDRKILITEGEGSNAEYITFNGADPFRYYSQLENFNVNGKISYELKWNELEDGYKNNLKFGYAVDMLNYDFNQKTIRTFGGSSLTDTTIDTNNPQAFFDNAFSTGALNYVSNPDPTYNILINQFTNAGFANYNRIFGKLLVDIGVRGEYYFKETKYRPEGASVNSNMIKDDYTVLDVSPVLNLKYSYNDNNNFRFTASKTSTKPRLREVMPFRYPDGDGSFTFGNPELKNTTNYNIDLKHEFISKNNLYISTTIFGKYIQDPITRLLTGTSTGFLTEYENFDSATLFGIEFESSISLDNLFKDSKIAKNTTFGINTIFMKSKEEADKTKFPALTNTSRSLQGASDFIINADVAYQIAKSEKTESAINLIFNTFSERIYQVGVQGADDVKEQPINMLDFTWRNTFNKKYQVNFSVKNILDENNTRLQDATGTISNPATYSNVNQDLNLGTTFGLEFIYTF